MKRTQSLAALAEARIKQRRRVVEVQLAPLVAAHDAAFRRGDWPEVLRLGKELKPHLPPPTPESNKFVECLLQRLAARSRRDGAATTAEAQVLTRQENA
jgi:hypothetical protein